MTAPLEVTDLVDVNGTLYRRMNNEAANVELARRGQGGSVSGELPPDAIEWEPMAYGDPLWVAIASGTLAPAPPV